MPPPAVAAAAAATEDTLSNAPASGPPLYFRLDFQDDCLRSIKDTFLVGGKHLPYKKV